MMKALTDLVVIFLPLLLSVVGVLVSIDMPKKQHKWWWRTGLVILGLSATYATYAQQRRVNTQHDTEQGSLEGQLKLMSAVMQESSCPSTAEIGAAVQQELAKRGSQRASITIAGGKLARLSSESLVKMAGYVASSLQNFEINSGWYGEIHEIELKSWADHEREEWKRPDLGQPSKTQKEWDEDARKVNDAHRAQLMQLLSDAEELRKALLNKMPQEAKTPEDNKEAPAMFAKALTDATAISYVGRCCSGPIAGVGIYLGSLANRVARIKTLKSAN